MRTYKDKEELKAEISKGFEKYIAEFDSIPEALKDIRVAEVDRTPVAENLGLSDRLDNAASKMGK